MFVVFYDSECVLLGIGVDVVCEIFFDLCYIFVGYGGCEFVLDCKILYRLFKIVDWGVD